jgi:transposase
VAERFPEPAVQKSLAVDRALITHDDRLLGDIKLPILKAATQHHAHTRYLLRTVPGIGEILSLVLLYEIHDIGRFPRVQACVSSGRLVKCTKESAMFIMDGAERISFRREGLDMVLVVLKTLASLRRLQPGVRQPNLL